MASLRTCGERAFRPVVHLLRSAPQQSVCGRALSGTRPAGSTYLTARSLLLGTAAVGGVYGIYTTLARDTVGTGDLSLVGRVHAASVQPPPCQPSVTSGTKNHALYLWIKLKPGADVKRCAQVVANLEGHVDAVCPPDMRDEDDEVIAGVGFGPEFYRKAAGWSFFGLFQIDGKTKQDYKYVHRSGANGDMPSTDGDIFVHAKSNELSKLFELAQRLLAALPRGSVASFEDVYGWVYRNGRDLTGFIDGTENPADDEERQAVAVEKTTGASYVITQKWEHKLDTIASHKASTLEGFVGRVLDDSTELKSKPITSHVARMTGGADFEQKKAFKIVRQSQPYGNLSGKAGLFFIGYSESPENFNYMLDRMVGKGKEDRHSDDIMKLTTCVKSTYWYFPSPAQLKKMA